jgi:hypothetical protein
VLTNVTASDNCTPAGSLTKTQSPAAGTLIGLGTNVITVTVRDGSSNSSTCTTIFRVLDTTPPVVSCPGTITGSAVTNCQAAIPNILTNVTASDNCTPVGSLTKTQNPVAGTLVGLGTNVITVTVRDGSSNSSTCTTIFHVLDTTPPVVSCPGTITGSAVTNCQAAIPNILTNVTASDNCTPAGSLTKTQNPVAGTLVGLGTNVITVTVRDGSSNSSTCVTTFTVSDTTPPLITSCSPAQSTEADASCQAAVPDFMSGVVASDCNGPLTITQSPAAGTLVGLGATTVTLTVKDAANNASTCTTSFTVNDATPPVITTCAPPQSASANASCQAAVPDFTSGVVASDCNGPLTFTQSPAAGTLVGLGATTVTLTIKDAANNASTCTTSFTVNDATPPVITTCTPSQSASGNASCQAAVPDFTSGVVASDCNGPLTITQSPAAGTLVGLGATTVTLTVKDAANNASTCTTSFTVNDATPPVISPITTSVDPVNVNDAITASATFTDNCGPHTAVWNWGDGTTSPATVSEIKRLWFRYRQSHLRRSGCLHSHIDCHRSSRQHDPMYFPICRHL